MPTALERLPNLKLVFLNACDTAEQAQLLLEVGIPIVIATTLPVEDEKAARFTRFFYAQLAGQASARDAFETAIGAVASKKEWGLDVFADAPGRIVTYTRGVQLELAEEAPPPWRLFIREGQESASRNWRLARPIETRGPLGIVQNLAIASDVLEEQAVYFQEQPNDIQEKIREYFTRVIEQLDKKIQLIEKEKAQELSIEVIRGEAAADVFKGIREHLSDAILQSILSNAEEQLRQIIGAKAQFLEKMRRSDTTEAEKEELIELLGFARVRFEALREML
ncbi:MAG: CHAT domain-containing protein [Phaeodactylibacter sp.]|nr:CHAT domain-containing protein [Phaeodactylibacter sp.]MCB9291539.1 CHAT domain-containing protein [Lewinellaceae bacterium]